MFTDIKGEGNSKEETRTLLEEKLKEKLQKHKEMLKKKQKLTKR